MVLARVSISNYANRVLAVVKAKYDLKDKSQALNKFIEMHGDEELEPKVKESYIKKLLEIEAEHFKKCGYRKMSDRELDDLFGK